MIVENVNGGVRIIGSKKGGGGSRQPVESPDSLHSTSYARVLDLLSEGEVVGLVDGLRSIYLDGTPIQNKDGSLNFAGVRVDFRNGTQYQDYIPGFPVSESAVSVGVPLTFGTPWVQNISNSQLSAIRVSIGVNSLSKVDISNGDTTGSKVDYEVDLSVNGGAFNKIISSSFNGKTTSQYVRTHRIDLPEANSWSIRVRRLTADSTSQTLQNATFIQSYSEVIDGKQRNPMCAIAGLQVDASQFSNIPTRAYHVKGKIISVPSNYDAEAKVYTGIWDGTLKQSWSDNPAWILYDLITNDRFGLGGIIPKNWVDKWGFYQIGQYCDELVPDGKGGQESRFTCNVYIQERADAYRLLQDMASIFRGMTYWSAGTAVTVADMPQDPAYTFTNANVINGRFTYSGTSLATRYNVAMVSWNDPTDFGRAKVEVVEDQESIARYGIKQTEAVAFGCYSQGQANRYARSILYASQKQTRSISFDVGLEGVIPSPGMIIRIADQHFAGRRTGGRISEVLPPDQVKLDASTILYPGDKIAINMPNGTTVIKTVKVSFGEWFSVDSTKYTVDTTELTADITSIQGATQTVTFTESFSSSFMPEVESVWTVESTSLVAQQYRVISVAENDGITFTVNAIIHHPDKFDYIDYNTRIQVKPVTVIPPSVCPPPTDVQIRSFNVINQGVSSQIAEFSWKAAKGATKYQIEWRRNNSDWVRVNDTATTRVEIGNIYSGEYVVRVRAINSIGAVSLWSESQATNLDGILDAPPVVTSLTTKSIVFGIEMKWTIPSGPSIVERTEIWYSQTNNRESAIKLGDFSYPQNNHTMMGLAAGAGFYFWARLVDKNGITGQWYPSVNGVFGHASSDANDIMDMIEGQIDESALAVELRTQIDKIPTLETGVGQNATAINTERTERIDADGALGQRIDTVQASSSSNTAAIQSETTARTDADNALSQRIDTVQATAGNASATAQTALNATASTDGKLSAMYTMKVQLNSNGAYHLAGIGVGVENNAGVMQSQVLVTADRFAILPAATSAATSASSPFIVQGGQVFIRDAFIGNATITSAKIADWLESDAVNALGQKVWRLNMRTGEMQFNGSSTSSGRLTINNNLVQVFDSSGTLRVRMGIW